METPEKREHPPPGVPENPGQVDSSMRSGVEAPFARFGLIFLVFVGIIWFVIYFFSPDFFSPVALLGTLFLVLILTVLAAAIIRRV
jgi:hypothetical protein